MFLTRLPSWRSKSCSKADRERKSYLLRSTGSVKESSSRSRLTVSIVGPEEETAKSQFLTPHRQLKTDPHRQADSTPEKSAFRRRATTGPCRGSRRRARVNGLKPCCVSPSCFCPTQGARREGSLRRIGSSRSAPHSPSPKSKDQQQQQQQQSHQGSSNCFFKFPAGSRSPLMRSSECSPAVSGRSSPRQPGVSRRSSFEPQHDHHDEQEEEEEGGEEEDEDLDGSMSDDSDYMQQPDLFIGLEQELQDTYWENVNKLGHLIEECHEVNTDLSHLKEDIRKIVELEDLDMNDFAQLFELQKTATDEMTRAVLAKITFKNAVYDLSKFQEDFERNLTERSLKLKKGSKAAFKKVPLSVVDRLRSTSECSDSGASDVYLEIVDNVDMDHMTPQMAIQ